MAVDVNGKGDRDRTADRKAYAEGWDRVFGMRGAVLRVRDEIKEWTREEYKRIALRGLSAEVRRIVDEHAKG